jgi:hypothetical protein
VHFSYYAEADDEESCTPPKRNAEDSKENQVFSHILVHVCMSMKMKQHFKKHLTS